jgi:hypothetical protein
MVALYGVLMTYETGHRNEGEKGMHRWHAEGRRWPAKRARVSLGEGWVAGGIPICCRSSRDYAASNLGKEKGSG